MDKGRGDSPQFRDPRFGVRTIRIVPSLLQPRIENPKIWLRIAAGRRAPLPVSIVDRGIVVHKLLRKVASPPAPVDVQILREERCDDHPDPIVQESSRVQLSHPCIDYRKPCLPGAPRAEFCRVGIPYHRVILPMKRAAEDVGEKIRNVRVEVTPKQLNNELMLETELGRDGGKSRVLSMCRTCGVPKAWLSRF